jgi:hypothetical protein
MDMNPKISAVALAVSIVFLIGLIARFPGMTGKAATGSDRDVSVVRSAAPNSTPVLVELFTSEGCSSCPPADDLLRRLGRSQPVRNADVIVLEEHVDYWDRLGWKDPFSSEVATARQTDYGDAFGGSQVYTPQMVVDGHSEFVGSSEGEALRAIGSASQTPKPAVHLKWVDGGMLAIAVDPLTSAKPGEVSQVYLAVTENMLRSDVKQGENAGRELDHDGVVRTLTAVGKVSAGSTGFSSTVAAPAAHDWNRSNLRAVVFVQEQHSRRVIAVDAIPFPIN